MDILSFKSPWDIRGFFKQDIFCFLNYLFYSWIGFLFLCFSHSLLTEKVWSADVGLLCCCVNTQFFDRFSPLSRNLTEKNFFCFFLFLFIFFLLLLFSFSYFNWKILKIWKAFCSKFFTLEWAGVELFMRLWFPLLRADVLDV